MQTTTTLPGHHGFVLGDRVEVAPHTDSWMRGDRFGAVTGSTAKHVLVRFDRSGRTMRLHPVVLTFVSAGA